MAKKITKTIFAGLIILCSCFFFINYVHAANFSNARIIGVNQDIQDNVNEGYNYEQKLYQFTTKEDGYIKIRFSNPLQNNSDAYWNVKIFNANYTELYSRSIYGNHESIDIMPIGLPADTYYIRVSSTNYSNAMSTDTYTINVGFTATSQWEKEINDTFTNATAMELNSDYYGTTLSGYNYEKDFYQIDLPQPGCVNISLAHELQGNSNNYWKIGLYNSAYQEISSVYVAGNTPSSSIPAMGLDSGTYYILVESTDYRYAASGSIYTVRADFTASNQWEKEFNETFTTATKIELDTDYYGTIRHGYDYEKDYYEVEIGTDGYYRIDITTPILKNSDNYWRVYLYDSAYEKVADIYVSGNHSNHYIQSSLSAGTYYIIFTSTSYNKANSTAVYQFKVSLKQNNAPEAEATSTPEPTIQPTAEPTVKPTIQPTAEPTIKPTAKPTLKPTAEPTLEPTEEPEVSPTLEPDSTEEPDNSGIIDDNHQFEIEDDGEFDDDIFNNGDDEDDDDEEDDSNQNASEFYNVEWNVASATLQVGKSTAKIKATSDNDKITEYITSNAAVATVNSKGIITARGTGNAIIRVITEHGCLADVRIKVQKKAVTTKKLKVKSRNVRLKVGKVYNLNTQITPITSSQRIRYKSSKAKVAVVNSKGQIKAKKSGKAVITVKSGKKTVKVKVIVKK